MGFKAPMKHRLFLTFLRGLFMRFNPFSHCRTATFLINNVRIRAQEPGIPTVLINLGY